MKDAVPPSEDSRSDPRRTFWRLVQAHHSFVYYAPDRTAVYTELGLRGGWMGYVATRSAALGTPPPDVVTACFYGFAPRVVERALPDAWVHTTPEAALAARLEVFDLGLRRLLGDRPDAVTRDLAERLGDVVTSLPAAGAPLFAAHRAVPRPQEPHLHLFWATTALREFRGDAHVAALRASDLDPVESNVVMRALGLVPQDHRRHRGWTEEEWGDALDRLRARGWLDTTGRVTDRGRRRRAAVEDLTDTMTTPMWERLPDDDLAGVVGDLEAVVEPIVASGVVP